MAGCPAEGGRSVDVALFGLAALTGCSASDGNQTTASLPTNYDPQASAEAFVGDLVRTEGFFAMEGKMSQETAAKLEKAGITVEQRSGKVTFTQAKTHCVRILEDEGSKDLLKCGSKTFSEAEFSNILRSLDEPAS